ncbi:MAG: hypothetical protein ABSH49_29150 [Bryobacteraceae bacterium]|jgi:hypothetical protein
MEQGFPRPRVNFRAKIAKANVGKEHRRLGVSEGKKISIGALLRIDNLQEGIAARRMAYAGEPAPVSFEPPLLMAVARGSERGS